MKRAGSLFEKICDIQNLHESYYKASKHKRLTSSCLLFRKNSEKNLEHFRSSLIDGTYRTKPYRQFKINDPKERIISVVPLR